MPKVLLLFLFFDVVEREIGELYFTAFKGSDHLYRS